MFTNSLVNNTITLPRGNKSRKKHKIDLLTAEELRASASIERSSVLYLNQRLMYNKIVVRIYFSLVFCLQFQIFEFFKFFWINFGIFEFNKVFSDLFYVCMTK